MPTKRIFVVIVLVDVFMRGAIGMAKVWSANHAQNDSVGGTVARAVSVI